MHNTWKKGSATPRQCPSVSWLPVCSVWYIHCAYIILMHAKTYQRERMKEKPPNKFLEEKFNQPKIQHTDYNQAAECLAGKAGGLVTCWPCLCILHISLRPDLNLSLTHSRTLSLSFILISRSLILLHLHKSCISLTFAAYKL